MNPAWLVVALFAIPPAADDSQAVPRPPAHAPGLRRLVDAVALADGRQLAVAGQRSGSIAIVDTATGGCWQEIAVGDRLEAIALGVAGGGADSRVSRNPFLAVVDSVRNELSLLSVDGAGQWQVERRIPVVRSPVSVCVARSGRIATIAGLWSRSWQVVTLGDDGGRVRDRRPTVGSVVSLPFAPRLQVELPDGRFFVTDAFGGQCAVLEANPARLVAIANWPIHNIRGLSLSPDGRAVVLSHQELNERLPIRRDAILAGRLIRNGLSYLPIDEISKTRRFESLDELADGASSPAADSPNAQRGPKTAGAAVGPMTTAVARGAGDPAGVAWLGDRRVVALSGLSECLSSPVSKSDKVLASRAVAERYRFATGARPLRVVALPAVGCVAVVGMLDDSLTFVDPTGGLAPRRFMLSPGAMVTPQDRGERAFFDARLSAGGFLSCHSCHSEAHTNGLLSDTLGDDTDGAPKRVPTLLGTGLTYRWGWNGAQQSLHDQVLKSIDQTMGGKPRFQDGTDMVAFFHTLAPPPPLEPAPPDADAPGMAAKSESAETGGAPGMAASDDRRLVERGRAVFMERGCGNCHVPPLVYASHESYDVGLSDERGLRKFNPPSLRGVSQAGRWLHDGRAGSLESVFRDHAHPNDMRWVEDELPALLRFLRSL